METVLIVTPDGREIIAELARTTAQRRRGLMFRDELGENEGMLLVFSEPGFRSIWMKNVRLPLDILWLEDDGRVIHLEHSVPPCEKEPCPDYLPMRKARYVLELNAGKASAWGLTPGSRLAIYFPPQ